LQKQGRDVGKQPDEQVTMDKNPRAKAMSILPSLWDTLHKQGSIPPTSELEVALPPTTSHLEGVGNDDAACAANTFIH
jgi:hypothetical protein